MSTISQTLANPISIPSTGSQLLDKCIHQEQFFQTGFEELDKILGGGLLTGEVTELFGLPASSKTQICLAVSVDIVWKYKCKVLYIDTKGGFSEERIRDLVEENHRKISTPIDKRYVMSRILVNRLNNMFSLLRYLSFLEDILKAGTCDWCAGLRMIIIDSVTAIVLPFMGGNQLQGQALMSLFSHLIHRIAVEQSLAILIINNAVRRSDNDVTGGIVPALGRSWASVPNTRVLCSTEDSSESVSLRTTYFTLVKGNR